MRKTIDQSAANKRRDGIYKSQLLRNHSAINFICAFSDAALCALCHLRRHQLLCKTLLLNSIGGEIKTKNLILLILLVSVAEQNFEMKGKRWVSFILRLIILDAVLVLLLAATFGVESEFASLLAPANVLPEPTRLKAKLSLAAKSKVYFEEGEVAICNLLDAFDGESL